MKSSILLYLCMLACVIGLSTSDLDLDLVQVATSRWCPPSSDLDKKCLISAITGYLSFYDLCSSDFSQCQICVDQPKYIMDKLPLAKENYSVTEFSQILLSMATNVLYGLLDCPPGNNRSTETISNPETNNDLENWIENVYRKTSSRLRGSYFRKCITFKSILVKSNLQIQGNISLSMRLVIQQVLIHQFSGFLLSRDCDLLPPPQMLLNDLYHHMGLQSINDLIMEQNLKILMKTLKIGKIEGSTDSENHHHSHRKKRAADDTAGSPNSSSIPQKSCLSVDNIYAIFNYNDTAGLSHKDFLTIAPILLQQVSSNSCITPAAKKSRMSTTVEKHGWGTLSVLIICLCSLFGLLLVPFGRKIYFKYFIVFFVALGVGTLVGDSVLHLIPEAMGIHLHDPNVIWKLVGTLIIILSMFVLENVMTICQKKKKMMQDTELHLGHSHMSNFEDLSMDKVYKEVTIRDDVQGEGLKAPLSAAIMVIVGDTIHNFADGLALGAAFTTSVHKGISTSIAIFCHELPHEFGDFAILLASGFKWKWALLANLLSSLTAFIGLYVGIAISSESPLTRQIIFAITAGMFLYVALTDMLPSLIDLSRTSTPSIFIVAVIGMVLGVIIMALLSFYEESIKI